MKMTQEQYNNMWRNVRATGTTMYGEITAMIPDEFLSAKDRELKQNVLRCQKMTTKAREENHAKVMRDFNKFLGW